MEITLSEVLKKFIDVINEKISREDASTWALLRMHEDEKGNLFCYETKNINKIMEGLIYLGGVDLQQMPGEYLFCKEDIEDEYIKTFGFYSDIQE